jgi:hypothetical protein
MVHVVEDKLQEMEEALCVAGQQEKEGVQLETAHDLTMEDMDFIREQIRQMRELVDKFVKEYGLHKQRRSLKNILSIKAAFLWEELSGATFDRLQGYGKVDDSERNRYEQHVEPMIRIAEKLMMDYK